MALTAQDNQRNTPRDTSITSTDNTNPDPEKTHPHSYLKERDTQTTTRGKCEGTLHRLTPMGKSTSPIHQTGQCHNHTNQKNQNTVNPTWELAQSRDQRGVNNFHQDPNGKIITTNTGRPYCNNCQLSYHSRQRCAFRLGDLKNNIDRQVHPQKGFLTKNEVKELHPSQQPSQKPNVRKTSQRNRQLGAFKVLANPRR